MGPQKYTQALKINVVLVLGNTEDYVFEILAYHFASVITL